LHFDFSAVLIFEVAAFDLPNEAIDLIDGVFLSIVGPIGLLESGLESDLLDRTLAELRGKSDARYP
jgi:hypothetical protein